MAENKLGSRIRKYREQLGLTQEQLARNAGFETDFIKEVEEGLVYPAIGNIIKISRALGQRVGTFMDDQFRPDPLITKFGSVEEEVSTHKGDNGHYHYYPLGKGKTDRHMEPMIIRVEENGKQELSSHEGEEFVIVTSGKIAINYGKKQEILEKGDSVYYNSVVPHSVTAVDGAAEVLAVIYVPM